MYPNLELDFGDVKIKALYGRHTDLKSGFNDLCQRLYANENSQADPGIAALQPIGSLEYRNFLLTLPNGTVGQLLDVLDYISNSVLMPLVAICTCVLVGYVVQPKTVIEEVESSGCTFGRKKLYVVMIKYIAPVLLTILLFKSLGILTVI